MSSGGGGLLKRIVVALSCGAIVVAGGAISLAILNSANYEGGDAPDVSEPTSSLSDSPNDSDLILPQIPEASNTIVEVRSGSDIDNMDKILLCRMWVAHPPPRALPYNRRQQNIHPRDRPD
ncbi:hypothetical protein, partial [Adlercreutzia rubneri]